MDCYFRKTGDLIMTYTQQEIEFLTSDEFQKAIKPYWKPKVGDWYANKIKTIRIITPDDEYCVGHYIGLDRNDYEYWLPTEHNLKEIAGEILIRKWWLVNDFFNEWLQLYKSTQADAISYRESCYFDTELLALANYVLYLLKEKRD